MFLSQRFLRNAEQPNNTGAGSVDVLKTKEEVDKRNTFRATQGLPPLPYPTEAAALSQAEQDRIKKEAEEAERLKNEGGELSDAQKEEAQKLVRAEADRIKKEEDDIAETARLAAIETGETTVVKIGAKAPIKVTKSEVKPEDNEDEIDETLLLKQLSKKAGREITSIEDFVNPKKELSAEDKENQLQERENQKLNFGLQNKKISKQEIESFIADTKNPQAVAFNFYAAQQKEIDPDLTDKQIKDSFEDRFSTNEDEDSKLYKSGQAEINFMANSIISKKHAKYLNLENEYTSFESEQSKVASFQKEILSKAPIYKRDVEAAAAKISKIKLGGYDVEPDKEVIDSYVAKMLTRENTEKLITDGYTVEGIEAAMKNSFILDNIDEIFEGVLEKDRLKNQAGLRGVIPPKIKQPQQVFGEKQNEERKKLQERLGIQVN